MHFKQSKKKQFNNNNYYYPYIIRGNGWAAVTVPMNSSDFGSNLTPF